MVMRMDGIDALCNHPHHHRRWVQSLRELSWQYLVKYIVRVWEISPASQRWDLSA
jgi:hypothetical protein